MKNYVTKKEANNILKEYYNYSLGDKVNYNNNIFKVAMLNRKPCIKLQDKYILLEQLNGKITPLSEPSGLTTYSSNKNLSEGDTMSFTPIPRKNLSVKELQKFIYAILNEGGHWTEEGNSFVGKCKNTEFKILKKFAQEHSLIIPLQTVII